MKISQFKEKLITLEQLGLKVYHNQSTEEFGSYIIWSFSEGNNFIAGNRIANREMRAYIDLYDVNEYNAYDSAIIELFDTDDSSIYLENAIFEYSEKGTSYTHYVYVVSFILDGEMDG